MPTIPYWRVIRCMRLYFHRKEINYALIREIRLIKSAFFNAGILNMRLTANMCLITRQFCEFSHMLYHVGISIL